MPARFEAERRYFCMKKMKTMAFSNLIGSIFFILTGIWAWIQTCGFKEIKGTYVQASTFSRIMIVGMLIFSAVLFLQSVFKLASLKEDDPLAAPAGSINFIRDSGARAAIAVILLCAFFVAMFELLGYILCSVIVSMAIMYLIGKRNWIQMTLVSVLVPIGMWLVFYKVLTVNIPMGPLTFLRDLIDKI